jgi:hypothetical protein
MEMSTLDETIIDCVGVVEEVEGCCTDIETRDVVEIIETIVKHHGKIRRLPKALKRGIRKCCASTHKSSEEENPQ